MPFTPSWWCTKGQRSWQLGMYITNRSNLLTAVSVFTIQHHWIRLEPELSRRPQCYVNGAVIIILLQHVIWTLSSNQSHLRWSEAKDAIKVHLTQTEWENLFCWNILYLFTYLFTFVWLWDFDFVLQLPYLTICGPCVTARVYLFSFVNSYLHLFIFWLTATRTVYLKRLSLLMNRHYWWCFFRVFL